MTGLNNTTEWKLFLLSDFNLENLRALLAKEPGTPELRAECAPYGQMMQYLLQPGAQAWEGVNAAVIWTRPEAVSAEYRKLLSGEPADEGALRAEVEQFVRALRQTPAHVKHIITPTWCVSPFQGRLGMLDFHCERGCSLGLMRMNFHLVESLVLEPRAVVLDAFRWVGAHGENSFSERLWYASKTPFSVALLRHAAEEIRAVVNALTGQTRKLVILDLDDTLWGGIVGDDGWRNLRLGGHDPVGEAYREFQLALRGLKARGILLGMVSKNEESVALEAIASHPEMVLKLEDFAGWRINWHDKARNISELASDLNLGLQSVIFIDDNPVERDRVRTALPEALVPEWPTNPMEYRTALQKLRCFDQAQVSSEDEERTKMYSAERRRKLAAASFQTTEEWLGGLGMAVTVEEVNPASLDRAAQLFNKTNQMNLATRRLGAQGLLGWAKTPGNLLLAFRVRDKFGDYGLVGICGLTLEGCGPGTARLCDFVLSCRAMGRRVEETMLHAASVCARAASVTLLEAVYLPTSKNQPCLRFLETAGGERTSEHVFAFNLAHGPYPMPGEVALKMDSALEKGIQDGLVRA